MAFCQKCGAQVADGTPTCPTCGAPMAGAPAPNYAPPAQAAPPANDAEANKGMAVLAYILFFVPLIAGAHKTSPFVKFHTNQGTVLWIASLIFGVVYGIVTAILGAIFISTATTLSGLGAGIGIYGVITTILSLLWIVPAVLAIMGIVNAVTGKTKPLPLIGKFTIIK
ncbi:MAG: zinc ribbon domain-containing protein [Coriobacteriia bacterium]|nr:zinc ribbon domain-containing protein [Coriobacteriia bacterium]